MVRTVSYPKFVNIDSIQSNEIDNYRYWLKIPFINKTNSKSLCVILKNPSVANNTICDNTISRVCNVANNQGYSEVIILNLFPYRSTQAKGVINFYNATTFGNIMKHNLRIIQTICDKNDVVFAWGTNTISHSHRCESIYDSSIKDVTSIITKNTYYVKNCSCCNAVCSNQHQAIRYPLHGLRWCNNSSLIPY